MEMIIRSRYDVFQQGNTDNLTDLKKNLDAIGLNSMEPCFPDINFAGCCRISQIVHVRILEKKIPLRHFAESAEVDIHGFNIHDDVFSD